MPAGIEADVPIEPPPARSVRKRVGEYLSLVRFSHTVFALPLASLAAVLAWTESPFLWRHLAGFLVCMVAARTAAMAFNRLADSEIDARNERTRDRHLPAGRVSRGEAIGLVAGSGVVFVLGTLLFLPNAWPLILAVPVLAWLLGYSVAKRFTPLCHYWLGLALGLSPVAAWLAITGTLAPAPVWLGLAVALWVGGFDILYACQDEAFDRAEGLRSVPASYGTVAAFRVARVSHLLAVAALVVFGLAAGLGPIYFGGLALIAGLLGYEHRIVSPSDLSRVGVAFFQMNALVSFGVFALGVADLIARSLTA